MASTGQPSEPRGWRLLLPVISVAQFLVVLDVTIVNMTVPALQRDLDLSATSLHWIVTAYAVAFGGGLLAAGRLGDLIGHRRVFATGLTVFTVASLVCGVAGSAELLIGARGRRARCGRRADGARGLALCLPGERADRRRRPRSHPVRDRSGSPR